MNNLTLFLLQAGDAGNAANAGKGQSVLINILFWVLLIVVFYFFMIRPVRKRNKEAKAFKESLQKGSKVITAGGIYGIIDEIQETYVMLEIANNTKIKVDKNSIAAFTETANK